ncbi:MAG: biopolymer transporter ExbD [Gammaproteobacteria bacterium]
MNVKRFDQISVVPFIDIMLVLLAIVLTTATFIVNRQLDVELPEAHTATTVPRQPGLTLTIDRQGTVYQGDRRVPLHELALRLSDVSEETAVVLRVDTEAAFGRFVAVIDALKANRLENLSIVAQPPR